MSDNVNKPSHYQGSKGLESIEVIDNFIGNLQGKAALLLSLVGIGLLGSAYYLVRKADDEELDHGK